jgi:hypothetical protein
VSRRLIPCGIPGVEKDPAWHGGRTPPCEETDLVRIGSRIEVSTHNAYRGLGLALGQKLDERTHLPLSTSAAMRVGDEVSRGKEEGAAWALDHGAQSDVGLLNTGRNGERSALDLCEGPPG